MSLHKNNHSPSDKSTHEARAETNLFDYAAQKGESPKDNPDSDKKGTIVV
jgi:hypothetical protein